VEAQLAACFEKSSTSPPDASPVNSAVKVGKAGSGLAEVWKLSSLLHEEHIESKQVKHVDELPDELLVELPLQSLAQHRHPQSNWVKRQ
jgi:hypothetical protein